MGCFGNKSEEDKKPKENDNENTVINDVVEEESGSVVIRFGGDIMMALELGSIIASRGIDHPWVDVAPLFQSADLSILNLETAVSTRGERTKRQEVSFRSHPDTLQGLVNAGVNMVSLANNHVLDYGPDAFLDTIKYLDEHGIKHLGAGRSLDEASAILYQSINGIDLAFIAATSIFISDNWKATENNMGIFPLRETYYELLFSRIREAEENSDYVILLLHWGEEHRYFPETHQEELARKLIDNGADIIIGTHSHSLHGIEYYNDGIIFYSTGNFMFLVYNENARKSAVFELTLSKNEIVSSRIYPIYIQGGRANLNQVNSPRYLDVINIMNERSLRFGTRIESNGYISRI